MMLSNSIGIIGGADGPTAVFVTGGFPWGIFAAVAVIVAGIVLYRKKKK